MSERRSRGQAVAFHLGGLAVVAAATVVAAVAAVLVSFGTSTCGGDPAGHHRRDLRLGLAAVGLGLTLVPVGWALLAARLRRAWQPWACLAAGTAVLTVSAVASAQVGTWCF